MQIRAAPSRSRIESSRSEARELAGREETLAGDEFLMWAALAFTGLGIALILLNVM
jgi:hypothetical protein